MDFDQAIETAGRAMDALGVAILAAGALVSLLAYAVGLVRRRDPVATYRRARRMLGRAILLGLEVLVAGDIVRSVAISPTFTSVGVLGAIVLIRSFLSMVLEVELEGRWPWQRRSEE